MKLYYGQMIFLSLIHILNGITKGDWLEAFPSAKHLCSWAGLTPTNNESAGTVSYTHLDVYKRQLFYSYREAFPYS